MADIRRFLNPDQMPADTPRELIELMDTRFCLEIRDITEVDPESGRINEEEKHQEEISALVDSIVDDALSATDEEVVLLYYLHSEGETDLWFDGLDDKHHAFYGSGTVIEEGSAEYAVIANDGIEEAFKEYATELIDDIDIPNIPENLRSYFDYEQRIYDLEMDGYGQMSSYDGNDNEVIVGGKYWHVFRLN
jgi:hypothetical protein